MDPTRKGVLWEGRGRGREDIRSSLRNYENVRPEDRVTLRELSAANRRLADDEYFFLKIMAAFPGFAG